MNIHRLENNPIISPNMDERIGENINGPSLIHVPKWVVNPLGKYYLYFAHHQGTFIRLAYADHLEGPWKIHSPGVLNLNDSYFTAHIASPDVHVLEDTHEIRMYYHGCCLPGEWHQATRLSISNDGLSFTTNEELLGSSYWRAFQWDGFWYTLEMPGTFRRSRDGMTGFEQGPTLFTENMRHAAVKLVGSTLHVFWSNAFDCPERILHCTIDLTDDWRTWQTSEATTLLTAETNYEGANLPIEVSKRGSIHQPVHQLRDPCIFEDMGKTYLLYTVAGEHGIAIAELFKD